MKKFKNMAAQGDLMIIRIDKLPENIHPAKPDGTHYVVAHSESGHHHVIEDRPNVKFFTSDDPMISYLQVDAAIDETEALLKHLKVGKDAHETMLKHLKVGKDAHETISFGAGFYRINRQRENTPKGLRPVQD